MVKKTKTASKEKEPKVNEPKIRSFVDYKVFEDNSAAINCRCNDKEMVALILILYKKLDKNAQQVINAVVRTLSLIDKV